MKSLSKGKYPFCIKQKIQLSVVSLLIFFIASPNAYSIDDPCSEPGLSSFKSEIYEIAKERQPDDAWRLAHALLCEEGEDISKFVYDQIKEKPHHAPNEYYITNIDRVDPLFKSKEKNIENIEFLLAKGEAYLIYVENKNICQNEDLKKCIYPNSIEIFSETGKNNGSIGYTYYLSFSEKRWIFTGVAIESD